MWAQDNNTFWMIKKFRQKWLVKKSKFVWRKKNPPRAQIFRYFRIESRNKNSIYEETKYVTEEEARKTMLVCNSSKRLRHRHTKTTHTDKNGLGSILVWKKYVD